MRVTLDGPLASGQDSDRDLKLTPNLRLLPFKQTERLAFNFSSCAYADGGLDIQVEHAVMQWDSPISTQTLFKVKL